MTTNVTGDDVIRDLGLVAHVEGGHYREVYRDAPADGSRGCMSSTYFLLRAGERSHWHRFDATEIWCHHAGSPLELTVWDEEARAVRKNHVGSDVAAGGRPQVTVPAGAWMTAQTLGDWTLLSCVCTPAFEMAGFELAPKGWSPAVQGHVDATQSDGKQCPETNACDL